MKAMKNVIIALVLFKSFYSFCSAIDIQSVSLVTTGGDSYLRVKTRGFYLDLDRINISYFDSGTSTHKILMIYEGCASSNALRNYDTTFQINSATPFDIAVYAIWDTSYLCGFLQEPFLSDSVFMTHSELLATTSITSLSQEFGEVYPNPTKEMITFDFEAEFVSIYDVNFSFVDRFEIKSKSIDLSHLQSGFYVLEFIQNNKKRLYRILKE
jgi:hypothetical protein